MEDLNLKGYMHLLCALVHGMNQCQRRHTYVVDNGKLLPDYTDTRWTSHSVIAEHRAKDFNDECIWLHNEPALPKNHMILLQVTKLVEKEGKGMPAFHEPICAFIEAIRVDIVSNGEKKDEQCSFGHFLCARVVYFKPQFDAIANNAQFISGLSEMLEHIYEARLPRARAGSPVPVCLVPALRADA